MTKYKWLEHFIVLYPAMFMAILLNSDINISLSTNVKMDTLIIVFGNIFIAVFVVASINKKHKDEELQINACFNELISFEELIKDLRNTENIQNDILLNRSTSLMRLKISIIKKYKFIVQDDIDKLTNLLTTLDGELTGTNEVNKNYINTLLQIEKRITVTKGNIL